jgi:NADPH:quinone reductase-like Zn-dependent oxidoreductase
MSAVNGTYAEYAVVDSADICRKPRNLAHDQAAAVPQACLAAYAALGHVGKLARSGAANQAKAVLILGGSGGVGSFAVQLARQHFGCGHVVASCSPRNAGLVESLGAHEVLDYTAPDYLHPRHGRSGRQFDVVVDCVGGDDYWEAARARLAPNGVYVTLVGSRRYLGDETALDLAGALQIRADYLVRQLSHQIGAAEGYHILTGSQALRPLLPAARPPPQPAAAPLKRVGWRRQVRSEDLGVVAGLLERGVLRVVVDRVVPLYEVVQATHPS